MDPSDAQKQWLIDHDYFDHAFLQILTGRRTVDGFDLCESLLRQGRLSPEQAQYVRQEALSYTRGQPSKPVGMPLPSKRSSTSLSFPGYQITREIGRGGMGVVYLGQQEGSAAEVVIKCMISDDNPIELVSRFHREARVLAQFNHKNIVSIKDFGTHEGQPYMVMPRIPGQDLKRFVEAGLEQTKALLPLEWTLRTMKQVAEGLTQCHSKGIVHRDLKPENIMIESPSETPILIDFGLAHVRERSEGASILEGLGQQLTKTGEVLGTPAYMAPEQLDSDDKNAINEKADVWGFGATLFFALTGRAPYLGSSAYNIYKQLIKEDPPLPSSINPNVPPWLDQLCRDTMTRDSFLRPSMQCVLERLEGGAPRSPWGRRLALGGGLILAIAMLALGLYTGPEDKTPPTQPRLIPPKKLPMGQSKDALTLFTKNPSITLHFQSKDENPGSIDAKNERSAQVSQGKYLKEQVYRVTVPLEAGKNPLKVSVIDKSGLRSSFTELTIVRSIRAPRITKLQMPELLQLSTRKTFNFEINGEVSLERCQVSFRGHKAEMNGRAFSLKIELSPSKTLEELQVTLTDPFGQEFEYPLPLRIVASSPSFPRTHKSLSAALLKAPPGLRLFLTPGRYYRTLRIQQSIDIIGLGEGVRIAPSRGSAIDVQSGHVRLRNLDVACSPTEKKSVIILKTGSLSLENCKIGSGSESLIHCGLPKTRSPEPPKLTLIDCIIERNSYYGIVVQNAQLNVENCQFIDIRSSGLSEKTQLEVEDSSVYSRHGTLMIGLGGQLYCNKSTFKRVKDRHITFAGGYGALKDSSFDKAYQTGIYFGWKSSGDIQNIHCFESTQEALAGINCKRITIRDSLFEKGGIGYIDTRVGSETSFRSPALDFASAGTFEIDKCRFLNNKGYAIHLHEESDAVTLKLNKCEIIKNDRGGILQESGQVNMKDCLISQNNGHGWELKSSKGFCQRSQFNNNKGFGIHAQNKSRLQTQSVQYTKNALGPSSCDVSSTIEDISK